MGKKKKLESALSIAKGVAPLPPVNPNYRRKSLPPLSTAEYIDGILKGNRSVLSRAITLIESNLPEHTQQAQKIIESCLPHTGSSIRVGITGVPGVGKSSFIEALGIFLTGKGYKLAVLAVDPSSERSKGSILGDKTRMENLSAHPNAFIRPSPSAGSLGGVARKTRESVLLCEAAGYDTIFIETVGVGQSETAVHSMVDFFLLLLLSGAGDELQGIKRGIVEMADMLVITKADGSNIDSAQKAATEFKSALHMFPAPDSGWEPKVLTCSAFKNLGISEVWNKIMEYKKYVTENNFFSLRRNKQALHWLNETIKDTLTHSFYSDKEINNRLNKLQDDILNNKISPFIAAQKILGYYFGKKK